MSMISSIKNISGSRFFKNGWVIVAMLFFVGALNYLDRTLIVTMRSIISSIPMTDAQFGLLISWPKGIFNRQYSIINYLSIRV